VGWNLIIDWLAVALSGAGANFARDFPLIDAAADKFGNRDLVCIDMRACADCGD